MANQLTPPLAHSELRAGRIERMDPEMAAVLRGKTGAERLAIAFGMFRAARRMIASQLRAEHPEWDDAAVERETARRIASGSG